MTILASRTCEICRTAIERLPKVGRPKRVHPECRQFIQENKPEILRRLGKSQRRPGVNRCPWCPEVHLTAQLARECAERAQRAAQSVREAFRR